MKDKFSKGVMEDVLYGDAGRIISNKIVDKSRWSVIYELIFELDGKYWQTGYSCGATEAQYEQPWEFEDMVECVEVEPYEETVVKYRAV